MRLYSHQVRGHLRVSKLMRTAPAAPLIVAVIDYVYGFSSPPLVFAALMDETGHVATAALLIVALTKRPSREFTLAALASSVLIDIDHVPMQFGWDVLTRGTPRPYTHSILSVLIAGCMGLVFKRDAGRRARGISFGITAHLIRDVATGGGVSLFWPVTNQNVHVSYAPYVVLLCLLSGVILVRKMGKCLRAPVNLERGRDIDHVSHSSWAHRLRLVPWRKG